MCISNFDPANGLCNGTRLVVRQLLPHLIVAESLLEGWEGKTVFIPKGVLDKSDDLPFTLRRIQFPVRLCFALTINKSQGQGYGDVGLFLPKPVFSHGQLFVGLSRGKCFERVKVKILPTYGQGIWTRKVKGPFGTVEVDVNYTRNVVYQEILKDNQDDYVVPLPTIIPHDQDLIDKIAFAQHQVDEEEDEYPSMFGAPMTSIETSSVPNDEDWDWDPADCLEVELIEDEGEGDPEDIEQGENINHNPHELDEPPVSNQPDNDNSAIEQLSTALRRLSTKDNRAMRRVLSEKRRREIRNSIQQIPPFRSLIGLKRSVGENDVNDDVIPCKRSRRSSAPSVLFNWPTEDFCTDIEMTPVDQNHHTFGVIHSPYPNISDVEMRPADQFNQRREMPRGCTVKQAREVYQNVMARRSEQQHRELCNLPANIAITPTHSKLYETTVTPDQFNTNTPTYPIQSQYVYGARLRRSVSELHMGVSMDIGYGTMNLQQQQSVYSESRTEMFVSENMVSQVNVRNTRYSDRRFGVMPGIAMAQEAVIDTSQRTSSTVVAGPDGFRINSAVEYAQGYGMTRHAEQIGFDGRLARQSYPVLNTSPTFTCGSSFNTQSEQMVLTNIPSQNNGLRTRNLGSEMAGVRSYPLIRDTSATELDDGSNSYFVTEPED